MFISFVLGLALGAFIGLAAFVIVCGKEGE